MGNEMLCNISIISQFEWEKTINWIEIKCKYEKFESKRKVDKNYGQMIEGR